VCTPVKRGANDDTHSVVLAGLSESDKVIVGPYKVLEKLKHDELVMDETADKKANGRPEPSESKEAEEAAVTVSVGS
jgi:hypothetical protein